jgi:hypothetical protein
LAYASSNGQPDGEDGQHEAVNQHSAVVIPNLPAHPTKSADWEDTSPSGNSPKNQLPPTVQSDSLMLPELTEAEKQSPIGISMVRIRSIQLFDDDGSQANSLDLPFHILYFAGIFDGAFLFASTAIDDSEIYGRITKRCY